MRRRVLRAQPHRVVPRLRVDVREPASARHDAGRLAAGGERGRPHALDPLGQRDAGRIRRRQEQQRRSPIGEQAAVARLEAVVAGIDRVRAPLEPRRHAGQIARLLAQHAHAAPEVDTLCRQRQKRVRRDALDRVGHHEEPHAHALHQPARERLGRDAHDGDPVHERGQRHHQTIVAADDLRETAQVEPRKRIAVDILANLDRAAQPVLHASARRRGRRGSGGMAGSARQQRLALGVGDAHAERPHHEQIAVRSTRLRFGVVLARSPRLIGKKLGRPHLALARLRGPHDLRVTRVELRRIFDRLLNQTIDRSLDLMEHQRVSGHGLCATSQKRSPSDVFTARRPHATLPVAAKASGKPCGRPAAVARKPQTACAHRPRRGASRATRARPPSPPHAPPVEGAAMATEPVEQLALQASTSQGTPCS